MLKKAKVKLMKAMCIHYAKVSANYFGKSVNCCMDGKFKKADHYSKLAGKYLAKQCIMSSKVMKAVW